MVDMGGLDNLIANTAYLQARKSLDVDSRELQRRRRSLMLPELQCCVQLRQALPQDFDSLCEQQPIGRRLFRDFLATVPAYGEAVAFLEEVQSWELAEEGLDKSSILQGLTATCVAAPAPEPPHAFLSPALATKCQAATTEEEQVALVALAKAEAMAFLQDQPFRDFLASPFYDKFLQWKVFEMQPVSDKYFTEFRVLGKGGFGEVCAVQVKNTGKMYACKKLDKKRLKKKNGEKMALSEKEILEKVSSPFIVSLAYAFESKSHLCLVMSLMNGGDLKFHIYHVGVRGLTISRVVFYSAQMTCGVLHLHSLGIVYRDLKPENVLLDDVGNCRLSDLGLAVQVQEGKPITQRVSDSSPQVWERKGWSIPQGEQSLPCNSSIFFFLKPLSCHLALSRGM
ncbi:Rhodopsin kinase [Galemys pyrenaicus]|uniref:G protein-coupled receptor kinase n=1 Tax=Galemys pyrenaicus TaxID=202257 RepID=A0A8J6DKD4_GALPY|nr:Rhodopsin kinase [Galemys pyrenaicus]